eukprot:COSAG02_NODE_54047_length_298_cov_0.778894_1_plen_80_part_10
MRAADAVWLVLRHWKPAARVRVKVHLRATALVMSGLRWQTLRCCDQDQELVSGGRAHGLPSTLTHTGCIRVCFECLELTI